MSLFSFQCVFPVLYNLLQHRYNLCTMHVWNKCDPVGPSLIHPTLTMLLPHFRNYISSNCCQESSAASFLLENLEVNQNQTFCSVHGGGKEERNATGSMVRGEQEQTSRPSRQGLPPTTSYT